MSLGIEILRLRLLLVFFFVIRANQQDCGILSVWTKTWPLAARLQSKALASVRYVLFDYSLELPAYKA